MPDVSASPRRLERARDDRIFAGVCGGLARHFGIDATVVRLCAAGLVVFGGFGALVYATAFVLVPEEGEDKPLLRSGALPQDRTTLFVGVGLLILALVVLAGRVSPFFDEDVLGPVLLAAAGAALLVGLPGRGRGADESSPEGEPGERAGGPAPDGVTPPGAGADAGAASAGVAADAGATTGDQPAEGHRAPGAVAAAAPPRRAAAAEGIAFAVLLLGGALLLAVASTGALRVDVAAAAGVVLAGAALIVAAFAGRATGATVVGFLLAAVAAVPAVADLRFEGGVGERRLAPTSLGELGERHRLALGDLRIDLRGVELPQGRTPLDAEVSVGRLLLIVPEDVRLVAAGSVAAGNLELVDRFEDGVDLSAEAVRGAGSARTLVLRARVGLGSLEVRRGDPPWPADPRKRHGTADGRRFSMLNDPWSGLAHP